jgi:chromate transporter
VLLVFLRLGCTSFGGPIAHLGYFQQELVNRRRWCSESAFAEIVGLAQSLPGPASSQVGFALGLLRSGWPGGLAAWIGFTLPSALLMFALALGHAHFKTAAAARILHAMQLVAVAVVLQAVITMRRSLAPTPTRLGIATAAAAIVLLVSLTAANLLAIAFGALSGLLFCRDRDSPTPPPPAPPPSLRIKRSTALAAGLAFLCLLLLTSFPASLSLQIFAAFYRTGALVFGGGHVVLPLLEHAAVARGWVTQPAFLSGYGVVQAMPGPLFTFAAYLGALIPPAQHSALHAVLALAALFLPGLLLMAAILPFWSSLRSNPNLRSALHGVNAGVVGIVAAALIRPLIPTAIHTWLDAAAALSLFALLNLPRVHPWMLVVAAAALSFVL